jgi:hypothetical protein
MPMYSRSPLTLKHHLILFELQRGLLLTMGDSPFIDDFPSNFGMGDGPLPVWTHVHGTLQLDAEYLGTEPPAIDQTLDWDSFINLDQVESGFV